MSGPHRSWINRRGASSYQTIDGRTARGRLGQVPKLNIKDLGSRLDVSINQPVQEQKHINLILEQLLQVKEALRNAEQHQEDKEVKEAQPKLKQECTRSESMEAKMEIKRERTRSRRR